MAAELASIAAFEESRARDALSVARSASAEAIRRLDRVVAEADQAGMGREREAQALAGLEVESAQVASELEEAKALVAQCEAELTVRADELKELREPSSRRSRWRRRWAAPAGA